LVGARGQGTAKSKVSRTGEGEEGAGIACMIELRREWEVTAKTINKSTTKANVGSMQMVTSSKF